MTDRQELEALRLSLKRVAQATQDPDVTRMIPTSVHTERGWNLLCAVLVSWVDCKADLSLDDLDAELARFP